MGDMAWEPDELAELQRQWLERMRHEGQLLGESLNALAKLMVQKHEAETVDASRKRVHDSVAGVACPIHGTPAKLVWGGPKEPIWKLENCCCDELIRAANVRLLADKPEPA